MDVCALGYYIPSILRSMWGGKVDIWMFMGKSKKKFVA